MSSIQFIGNLPSSPFPISIAAGLPNLSVGSLRCFGRDTMICLRGLLLIPQRYDAARVILLNFASLMRHGLIPNFVGLGKNCRYNSRDATWFFMEALQEYVKHDKNKGVSIFKEIVLMEYLADNQQEHERLLMKKQKKELIFSDIIQNVMQSHASGIDFTEWNAGTKLDSNMVEKGFYVNIRLDTSSGFIYGGNQHNQGTWMDKIGSSIKAGNKGIPASPRDGADIEIIGLLRSAVRFLEQLNSKGEFPYEGVKINENLQLTYKKWVNTV